jgi:hypothetical protein
MPVCCAFWKFRCVCPAPGDDRAVALQRQTVIAARRHRRPGILQGETVRRARCRRRHVEHPQGNIRLTLVVVPPSDNGKAGRGRALDTKD